MALSSHFPLPKTLHSSKQFAFFVKCALFAIVLPLSNGATGDRNTETNDRIFGCTVLLLIEKMNQINTKNYWKLIPKTIGNRKRDCAWGCLRRINTTSENLQIEKHKSGGAFVPLTGLICAFWSADFLRWCLSSEGNLTHNLFFYFQ